MIINDQELHEVLTQVLGISKHKKMSITYDELKTIINKLYNADDFFAISFLHRNDLATRGFVSDVSSDIMQYIARIMDVQYLNHSYWSDLDYACEKLKIPKK